MTRDAPLRAARCFGLTLLLSGGLVPPGLSSAQGVNVTPPASTLRDLKVVRKSGAVVPVFATDAQDRAFRSLVRDDYHLFTDSMQLTAEVDDLDGLRATVFTGGVRGLFTVMECIIMASPAGKIWAAAIDDDLVKYFTNDEAFADRRPRTIERWRARFSDKKVVRVRPGA